jgi:F-type H+-transporting ATPase subunit delta
MPTNRLVVKEQIAVYASTLFDAASSARGVQGVLEARDQAKQIIAAMRGNADLEAALSNTAYTPEQRATIARNVFAGCEPALLDVLAVMAERCETGYLSQVANSLEGQLSEKLDTVVVDVTTVVELDDHLRELIQKKAETELGKKVVLNEHIDKSLLGGVVLSTSDERIDASLLTQIENARNVLRS